MSTERTVVALSNEARAAVAKRMAARGETASAYFSGGAGGSFVDQGVVESVGKLTGGQRADALQQNLMAPVKPDDNQLPVDLIQAYRKAQAVTGLRQGQQDVALTMSLFMSPAERKSIQATVSSMKSEAEATSFEDARSLGFADIMARGAERSASAARELDLGRVARRGYAPSDAPLSGVERSFENAYLLALSHRRKRSI